MNRLESRVGKLEGGNGDDPFAALSHGELQLLIDYLNLAKDEPESEALPAMKASMPVSAKWEKALSWGGIYQWLGRDLYEITGLAKERRTSG